jgi:hypothetical protein
MSGPFNALAEVCADVRNWQRRHTWDKSLFVVMVDYGKFGVESITKPDMTRASLIKDIFDGQFERIIGIFELNPVEQWSRDITSEILDEVEVLAEAAE